MPNGIKWFYDAESWTFNTDGHLVGLERITFGRLKIIA